MSQALTNDGIQEVVSAFTAAARRACQAGFRVIEIHAAHGYLIHEFLSPLSNKRSDDYGGSFENRTRLCREIVAAVRSEWPKELPLFLRISSTDWVADGWNINESVKLAGELKQIGVDLIDCSSGGNVPHAKIPVGPGYQTHFAERIRREAGIMTGAVGMITSPVQAEHIIRTEQADAVIIARVARSLLAIACGSRTRPAHRMARAISQGGSERCAASGSSRSEKFRIVLRRTTRRSGTITSRLLDLRTNTWPLLASDRRWYRKDRGVTYGFGFSIPASDNAADPQYVRC
jgi:hypothetical protein